MVLAITFGQPVAFLLVVSMSFYLGFLSPRALIGGGLAMDVQLTVSQALGGMVAVLGMAHVRQQSRPFMVGLYAGLMQGAVVLAFELMGVKSREQLQHADFRSLQQLLQDPYWALVGGLISGAAVTCFLPALERFFGVVTERRLLAFHDPSNQLLTVLRTQAPGTHTHSLRVADLASAAAEAIGADPLLSRVGAYYHDIGKLTKPEYFVENRDSGSSIHDRLRPSMSKLIIISHVKEGVELAEEAKLPQKIVDMIPMHHGTTVVEYFFHKAKTEGDASEPEVEYRYPGPRPRFREAGILMLADGVEATAKTIAEPNASRFRDMVHSLVLKRLLDHQLDECDLTMRDLTRIEDSFVRTLTFMYHGRIRYPDKDAHAAGGPSTDPRGIGSRRMPPAQQAPGLEQRAAAPEQTPAPEAAPAAFGRQAEAPHEDPNHHRQPAEVTSARSGADAKDSLRDPQRSS
jgi:putative nucleotidyltransferase with HDIG domain